MDMKRSEITRVETRFLLGDSLDITLLGLKQCFDMPHPLEFPAILNLPDRPFRSSLVPLFQNESWCKRNEKGGRWETFPYERFEDLF